ncbi:tudor domain-containing protein 3-like [Durio zibethinus]|uniref:Tudor domain-containing protein 3-like n=1 Tax=Durio zibethinus TaxID=66656 RepID=A0A6P5XX24_DURZI|nr:tudor domain-containing protein 3-like [Durio zibethinus]
MEGSSTSASIQAVEETLRTRGWFFGNSDEVKALIVIHTALSDDVDSCLIADSVEPELINMDLRSIGGKSLPDPNPRKSSYILGPKILQISSVRDISRSSIAEFSGNSSSFRLLRLGLTDGHSEITAIEYSHIPAIPDNVVPGTKIRLENKAIIHGGILCLNPKVVTLLGGVVQSLHEEWEMNQKYSGFSRSSLRSSQESGTGGPPSFEKLQIEAPSSNRFVQPGRSSHYSVSTLKNAGPTVANSAGNTESRWNRRYQTVESKPDTADNGLKTAFATEKTEGNPNSSETRPKEVAESVPLQNQAASQKLLQKMSHSNHNGRHSKGRKYRGKEKQEEHEVLTLDEWEKMKAGSKPQMRNELPETSCDEDFARQLQTQLDLDDYHAQRVHDTEAENIKRSMFNYEREDGRNRQEEHRGRGRGRGRGGGRGKGRGRGRGRFN